MEKITLSEIPLIYGPIDMPKGFDIDRNKIKNDIILSFIDNKRITNNNKHSSGDDSKAFRGNYAGIGMTYDEDNDIFITKKPYASWVLNTAEAKWQSPVGDAPELSDEEKSTHIYQWDESAQNWNKIER